MSLPPPVEDPYDRLVTPVVSADGSGRIDGCNAAFARWLGVSARRLQGLPLAALEVDGDALQRALGGGEAVREGPLHLRHVGLAFPGTDIRIADAWLSWLDTGWLLEAHPVEEFPGEDPLQALPSALAAALKGLAHELRNPLAGIKGAGQLLARRLQDSRSRELVDLVQAEVARLAGLVDELLAPTPSRAHAPLNIHAVLERVLRLAEQDAGWAVKLARDYDPSLPELAGDADRLAQAAWNLVRNAIQAGAATITLRTRMERGARIGEQVHAGALRMEIIDDGRGVPAALAEQIFLPLVSGRADGTGLGLAVAQQVAREHRGVLAWRSRPGHTVFSLLLPMSGREDDNDD